MIQELLGGIGKVFNSIWKVIAWLQRTWLTTLALLMSIVITPIQWAIDTSLWLMDRVIAMVTSLTTAVNGLRLSELNSYLGGASYFIGLADNFVPMGLFFGIVTALFSIWVIVQTVKVSAWLFRRIWDLIP